MVDCSHFACRQCGGASRCWTSTCLPHIPWGAYPRPGGDCTSLWWRSRAGSCFLCCFLVPIFCCSITICLPWPPLLTVWLCIVAIAAAQLLPPEAAEAEQLRRTPYVLEANTPGPALPISLPPAASYQSFLDYYSVSEAVQVPAPVAAFQSSVNSVGGACSQDPSHSAMAGSLGSYMPTLTTPAAPFTFAPSLTPTARDFPSCVAGAAFKGQLRELFCAWPLVEEVQH